VAVCLLQNPDFIYYDEIHRFSKSQQDSLAAVERLGNSGADRKL
jgi:replication-associated recombination protein RarA